MTQHIEQPLLSAYLDQELEHWQQQRIEKHLAHCVQCRGYLHDLISLQQQLQQLKAATRVPELSQSTLTALAKHFDRTTKKTKFGSWSDYSAAAAAILLGLFIGQSLFVPAISQQPNTITFMQTLGAQPPGALCPVAAHCYLEVTYETK